MTFNIVAVSGSLRAGSSNTGLVRMAQRIASTERELGVSILPTDIDHLPFYNADLEDPTLLPEAVLAWRTLLAESHGLFIAAPEYNFGPSAVLKNAIDWASRPPGQHVLRSKAISIVSSSASTGGKHMIEQLGHVLTLLGNSLVVEGDGMFVKGAERIAADGSTSDPEVEEVVRKRLSGLAQILGTT